MNPHLRRLTALTQAALAPLLGLVLTAGFMPSDTQAQVSVNGDLVREHAVVPGRTQGGTIEVVNPSGQAQDVTVTLSDYRFDADGSSHFERAGSLPRSLAPWITFAPARMTLAPGATAEVSYAIEMPAGAAGEGSPELSGSYWAAILVEGRVASPGATPRGEGVGVVRRVRHAVQVAAHLGRAEVSEAELSDLVVARDEGGSATLSIDLLNDGPFAYRPILEIQLFDRQGASAGKFRQARGLLFPGTSLRQRFDLGPVAPGTYEVLLTIDTGSPELIGTQFRIDL